MQHYTKEEEATMLNFYLSLDESSKRRYAALESSKLGHGGKKYIKELFGTSYDSISKGLIELSDSDLSTNTRIRKPGGGRKAKKTMKK